MPRTGPLLATALALAILGVACGGQDPVDAAAQSICDAIDAEPSDEAAYEGLEREVARERRAGMDEIELRAAVDERCGRVVTAISSAAANLDEAQPEPDPEQEPEPDPEPDFVDLRSVDWAAQLWSSDCTLDGEDRALPLTKSPWDEPGVYVHDPDPASDSSAMVYSVDIDAGVISDVADEEGAYAVFLADCFLGNDYIYLVEVWSHDDNGDPYQLPMLLSFSKWDGRIDRVEVVDDRVRVHTFEPAPGEETPHLNGYAVEVVTDWSYAADGWLDDEVSRVDASPEPEPEPEPAPEPEPDPSACEMLGFPGEDEGWCSQVLADIEECYREMDADPNWVPYLDSLFENVETGAITSCDI